MNNVGWSAPLFPVDAGTARQGILWQHVRIRSLLEKAQALAEARLDGEVSAPEQWPPRSKTSIRQWRFI